MFPAPGPTLINDMLTMWLGRDVGGEPAPGVADEWRTGKRRIDLLTRSLANGSKVSGRAGFRPIGGQGVGNHCGGHHSGRSGGPRERNPRDDAFDDDDFAPTRRRHPPSREPRNHPLTTPRGDHRDAYGPHRSPSRPSRGDDGPRRGGGAPPSYGGPLQRNPFEDAFDDDDFAPRGAANNPYGTHRSRQQPPGRGDHGPRRRGGAPPVRGPHDRAPADGPSRRSAQPPRGQRLSSAAYYSEEESEDEF